VQISVVVATIQIKTLKTEVEKGFTSTAIGRELVGPKELGNSSDRGGFLVECLKTFD